MGNVSHPGINRWGLNLFWYNLWFTDKNYAASLHQDKLFIELFFLYLQHDRIRPRDVWYRRYWGIRRTQKRKRVFGSKRYPAAKQIRRLESKTVYRKAKKVQDAAPDRFSKHLYTSRIWILRYSSWLVLNFYSFSPLQMRIETKKKKVKKVVQKTTVGLVIPKKKNSLVMLKRLYFFSAYLLANLVSPPEAYKF